MIRSNLTLHCLGLVPLKTSKMGRNTYFQFKQFRIEQKLSAMKVGTDAVLLGAWSNPKDAVTILDIGSGTGILSLMMAQRTKAGITAIELDKNSCLDAKINFANSTWADRIVLINEDILDFVKKSPVKFDFIICNPPYFSNGTESPSLERGTARHQKVLTLNELAKIGKELLTSDGKLALILPVEEGEQFIRLTATVNLFLNRLTRVKPNPIKPVRRLLMEFSNQMQIVDESVLMLEHEKHHDYTDEHRELTKDFYLKF